MFVVNINQLLKEVPISSRRIRLNDYIEVVSKVRFDELQAELERTKAALHTLTEPPLLTNDTSNISIE